MNLNSSGLFGYGEHTRNPWYKYRFCGEDRFPGEDSVVRLLVIIGRNAPRGRKRCQRSRNISPRTRHSFSICTSCWNPRKYCEKAVTSHLHLCVVWMSCHGARMDFSARTCSPASVGWIVRVVFLRRATRSETQQETMESDSRTVFQTGRNYEAEFKLTHSLFSSLFDLIAEPWRALSRPVCSLLCSC